MKNNVKRMLSIAIIAAAIMGICAASLAVSPATFRRTAAPEGAIWVDEIDLSKNPVSWGSPRKTVNNAPIMMSGMIYPHGIGAFPGSALVIDLGGGAERFMAMAGVNDLFANNNKVIFEVRVDGKTVAKSDPMKSGDAPKMISADLKGAKKLTLIVSPTLDSVQNTEANWGGALIALAKDAKTTPAAASFESGETMEIAHTDLVKLGIHGPRVTGSTPGHPFIFRIPATGRPPLSFSAAGLPDGLSLDPKTGVITGSLKSAGDSVVTISVSDSSGTVSRKLRITGGEHKLALTPPMGWNSWNVWGTAVSQDKVRDAVDAMLSSGLASFGYQYVNIDDAWEDTRDASGEILTNSKFPDMRALSDYTHSNGLKLGIYSSPGPRTCGGYEASYQHELQDAKTFDKWGIDYLKYDWCSYGSIAKDRSREELMKPYLVMRDALYQIDRDIVYSLCQYGMGEVWAWGAEVGGNLWRTTGDITDTWASMSGIGFNQNGIEKHAGPGHWNDPDMLVVGHVGWGPSLHPSRLTQNEQITHITLWSMLASPLLIGCDMTRLDQFTLDVLTNGGALDVNQDPLGKQGRRVAVDGLTEVWARPLWDGTVAVALFNRFIESADVTVKWADIGVSGAQPVRDLWREKDLGVSDGSFTAKVSPHAAVLLKIGTPDKNIE